MSIERRDPLPPGKYSIFVRSEELPTLQKWASHHRATVKDVSTVDQRELVSPSSAVFSFGLDLEPIWKTVGASVFFAVTAPTPWVGLGFPTIETSLDAWKKESTESGYVPPPGPIDELKSLVMVAAGLYLGGMVLQKFLKS